MFPRRCGGNNTKNVSPLLLLVERRHSRRVSDRSGGKCFPVAAIGPTGKHSAWNQSESGQRGNIPGPSKMFPRCCCAEMVQQLPRERQQRRGNILGGGGAGVFENVSPSLWSLMCRKTPPRATAATEMTLKCFPVGPIGRECFYGSATGQRGNIRKCSKCFPAPAIADPGKHFS